MSAMPAWVQVVVTIATVATPIVLSIFTIFAWLIKNRIEASQKAREESQRRAEKLEAAMRADRLEIYNEILAPLVVLLSPAVNPKEAENDPVARMGALKKMESVSYRQTAFKLSLFAADNVVREYSKLMQFFRKYDPAESGIQGMKIFGRFLLEIRKSVGNETSSLEELEMLEWLKDFE
ncbi:MAG: hypothetical protein OXM87_02865 [Truepera sp.]|nr:hypothetical protein [Truepera sp.]